jgi:hypothetical protein
MVNGRSIPTRQLTGFEHSLTITDMFGAMNAVCVLKIEGSLDPGRLADSLRRLQHRHRLLRARIVPEKGGFAFIFDDTPPIPLDCREKTAADDWIDLAQRELDTRLDIAVGPLMRCHYLMNQSPDNAGGEIVVTIQHSILDATSALPLLYELLSGCESRPADSADPIQEEGVLPATALFPAHLRGAGFGWRLAQFMGRQMAGEASLRWKSRGGRKPVIQASGSHRILPMRLQKPLASALIRCTRQRRITLNAILSAAMLLAVKRVLYAGNPVPLRNLTFADLRPYLSRTIPDSSLGCFMGLCRFDIMIQDRVDFWKLAKSIQLLIYLSNQRGERFLANALSPAMMKMVIRTKSMRMGTTALSYAGPIPDWKSESTLRLTGLHAFTSNITMGPEYSALVRLFQGELWWDGFYLDSDIPLESAERIDREIVSILKSAAELD